MRHISILSILMFLLTLLFGISLLGCGYKGNGKVIVERRNVGTFKSVVIEQESQANGLSFGTNKVSGFNIRLIQDSVEYTSIEYDENLMHHIKTQSVNNQLLIQTKKTLYSNRDIYVNVHYKQLEKIDASSFAEIVFATPFHGNKLKINLTGACDIKGEVFVENLDMNITGAADIEIKGSTRKMKGDFSGAGNLDSFGMKTDSCFIDITGAADAKVHALQYLKVDVSGAGEVVYKGSPLVVKNITGAGEVRKSKKDTM